MPSGRPRIIINTRERFVSTDINRAQSFEAQATQEAWRAQYSDLRSNWRLLPGVAAQAPVVATPSPLYGEVYSGLFVRPDAAAYLTVEPGLAMMIATTAPGVDDSAYLYVRDPGLMTTPNVLAFTANATASSVRWDVIECQPVDTLLESSSRDIYVPATGLFTPTNLDKVRATRLTYRIRLGTPTAGFPGPAAGWLPLAVCAVLDTATGFNQCDFYDVRPLVSERVLPQPVGAVGNEGLSLPSKSHYTNFEGTFSGYSESEFAGYLAGGALRTSVPALTVPLFGVTTGNGGDRLQVEVTNPANKGPHALGNYDMAYLAALFPMPAPGQGFIPRWARYSEAAIPSLGRRAPNGPRGILVITTTQPGPNNLFAPVSFPVSAQLGVNGIGPAIAMGSSFSGAAYGYSTQQNSRYEHSDLAGDAWNFVADTIATDLLIWNMVAGQHFPPGCKAIRVSLALQCTAAASFFQLLVSSCLNGYPMSSSSVATGFAQTGGLIAAVIRSNVMTIQRPAISTPYPTVNTTDWTIRVKPGSGAAGVSFVATSLVIHGWEF